MGAPKQKWTNQEETALKAGVVKHGAGKWRTILKDPEFSDVLYLRSNVDLKDKWRNMSVMANGWGSRDKARLALKRLHAPKKDESIVAQGIAVQSEDEFPEAKTVSLSLDIKQIAGPKQSNVRNEEEDEEEEEKEVERTERDAMYDCHRLDNLIIEAISTLRERSGSIKNSIALYIEDQYWAPPDFKRLLSSKLKFLTASGKLVKVKRRYRLAPTVSSCERRGSMLLLDDQHRASVRDNRDEICTLAKAQMDLELAKMRTMTSEEAAAVAARAVAEAEAAIAEAEEAAREAEAAEADAAAAQSFAEAAMKTLKGRNLPKMQMVGV
ncbi:telomere repeat-binding factor 1-like [Cucurbita pepo subsp. pepo]|uniref:telomere repeat-binding factor 1-like n=1 Tax=Cucurbita pepo subsp. pepo TaxID=3664 RepID=UPI000C9D6AE4|nr:telomere repeat-binding factor 1-like [Cucurbita pepo subsp. pepo]